MVYIFIHTQNYELFLFFRPTITIENGKSEEKVVPVNQVRPIKKESRKSDEKNNLEVVAVDYRRHKSTDHKREKSNEKHRTEHVKNENVLKKEPKQKDDGKHRLDEKIKKYRAHSSSASRKQPIVDDHEEGTSQINAANESKAKDQQCDKDKKDAVKETHDKKNHHKKASTSSHKPENRTRRTSNTDKKLVKSIAICDDTDADFKIKKSTDKSNLKINDGPHKSNFLGTNDNQFLNVDKSIVVKPPNVLVYADSFVAKENVKAALVSILNRDK